MKAIFAITLFAFVAVAQGAVNRNLVTDIITGLINANRGKLANLTIESIDLAEFGNVTDLLIRNAETFVLEKLESPGPLSVDISNATVSLEIAYASANIDLVNVEVPEIGLLVNGVGEASGSASNLFFTISLDINLDGLKIQLKDFSNLYISIGSLEATLTGVDNADEVNAIINSKLAGYLNDNLVTIANENKEVIIQKVNEILGGL